MIWHLITQTKALRSFRGTLSAIRLETWRWVRYDRHSFTRPGLWGMPGRDMSASSAEATKRQGDRNAQDEDEVVGQEAV